MKIIAGYSYIFQIFFGKVFFHYDINNQAEGIIFDAEFLSIHNSLKLHESYLNQCFKGHANGIGVAHVLGYKRTEILLMF